MTSKHNHRILLAILFTGFAFQVFCQVDTTKSSSQNLLDDIISGQDDSTALLPDKMPYTQRVLWGQKGVMRNFDFFELTPQKRQRELNLRRNMLVTHQVAGFITLGSMVAQGIVGAQLYSGRNNLKDAHSMLGVGVNVAYFTTAGLSLFAPPKMLDDRKGYSSIKLHKILAFVHFSGMILTNVLASQLESNSNLKPYHRAAAFTAFGAFAASIVVIKF